MSEQLPSDPRVCEACADDRHSDCTLSVSCQCDCDGEALDDFADREMFGDDADFGIEWGDK